MRSLYKAPLLTKTQITPLTANSQTSNTSLFLSLSTTMADTVAEMPIDPVPTRRQRNKRKALKEKSPSANEANIMVGKVSQPSPSPVPLADDHPEKENLESLSQPRSSPKKGKAAASKKQPKQKQQSFEQDLLEMQEKLQQLLEFLVFSFLCVWLLRKWRKVLKFSSLVWC
jgi:hypothetical protein